MGAVAASTEIEGYLRSREELAGQLALLRLERAAAAAKAWRQLRAERDPAPESLRARYQRVNGRPLAGACPTDCSCRGAAELAR